MKNNSFTITSEDLTSGRENVEKTTAYSISDSITRGVVLTHKRKVKDIKTLFDSENTIIEDLIKKYHLCPQSRALHLGVFYPNKLRPNIVLDKSMLVQPVPTRTGKGAAVLKEIEIEAEKEGIDMLYCVTEFPEMRNFLLKHGFKEIASEDGKHKENAILGFFIKLNR